MHRSVTLRHVFCPVRMKPLACLIAVLGVLPLAAIAVDAEPAGGPESRQIPMLPATLSYQLAMADADRKIAQADAAAPAAEIQPAARPAGGNGPVPQPHPQPDPEPARQPFATEPPDTPAAPVGRPVFSALLDQPEAAPAAPGAADPAPAPFRTEAPDAGEPAPARPIAVVATMPAAFPGTDPQATPESAPPAFRTGADEEAAASAPPVTAAVPFAPVAAVPAVEPAPAPAAVTLAAAVPAQTSAPVPAAPPAPPLVLAATPLAAVGTPVAAADPEPAVPPGEPLALKTEDRLNPLRPVEDEIPVFVQGAKISGQTGVATTVEGDAELRKRGSLIKAETITYWPPDDEMLAKQDVRALKNGDLFTGTELRLKLDAQTGYFLNVHYLLAGEKARGEAKRLDFLGQDSYRAENATYTTCGPGNDDWYLKVGELQLDYGRDLGEAQDAQLYFKDHKILSLPGMSFTLNDRRKSGFLAPSFGSSIQSGQEFSIPYYWNIAPNRDLLLTERFMTKRGLQTSAAFRYMGETYRGQMSGEILPNDHLTNTTRSGFSILHNQEILPRVIGNLNLNKVSDNTYFTDLSARLALTAQTYLIREGSLGYYAPNYSLVARAQSYQTLQDPLNPVAVPYFRLPQVTFNAVSYDNKGFDLAWNSDFTRFASATQVMGNRLVVNPSVSYPLITPGAYITPKLTMHATRYHLEEVAAWQTGVAMPANAQSFITRNVPIFSLDSGMTFEKPATYFGQNYTQTIEPRLYYLRVPYRDQSNIPIFDTALADFNFSQIFSENIYTGSDRIADANQLTFAVSTRLLNAANGSERIRATFGQRYYFNSQQVTLPGETPRVDKTSDLLAAISGEVLPNLRLDSAIQYSPNQKQIQRVSHGVRWTPEPGNTLSAAYRYQRDLLEQVDFAAQWRLATRWYGVGRYNYSIRDGRVVEALGGFEYDGGCWVGRVVVQRYALATQKASTSIFFQIELNGLSRLGSNPLEVLRRNIPGYTKLNENQSPQPRTFNNYE